MITLSVRSAALGLLLAALPLTAQAAGARVEPPALLVHTGQHYDQDMSGKLFEDLRLPRPDINLEVGSGSHAVQTADVMKRFEPVLDEHKPSCVLVVGDVNFESLNAGSGASSSGATTCVSSARCCCG